MVIGKFQSILTPKLIEQTIFFTKEGDNLGKIVRFYYLSVMIIKKLYMMKDVMCKPNQFIIQV